MLAQSCPLVAQFSDQLQLIGAEPRGEPPEQLARFDLLLRAGRPRHEIVIVDVIVEHPVVASGGMLLAGLVELACCGPLLVSRLQKLLGRIQVVALAPRAAQFEEAPSGFRLAHIH